MNKKGQVGVWAFALMLGLTVVIVALAMAPAGQDVANETMSASTGDTLGLDCDNASISTFQKGTCIITDFSMFYFFGALILIGGGLIVAKIIV